MSTKTFRPAQIMLVEDNDDDIELTITALENSKIKMNIHVVKNGHDALEFLRNQGAYQNKPMPDLVLLDLNLPIMDGREVLREIRKDENLTGLPVVVLTTSQNEEDILKMYQLHANCYITKPVDFLKFAEVIKQIEGFWLQLVKLPSQRSR